MASISSIARRLARTSFGEKAVIIVREADEMKIAQHFSAGVARNKSSSPQRGLLFLFTFDPTDESVGYFHVVRFADENGYYSWARLP